MSVNIADCYPPSVKADLHQIRQLAEECLAGKFLPQDATKRIAAAARSIQLRIEASTHAPVAHAAPDELGPRVLPQTIDPHAAPPQDAKAFVCGIDVTADEVRATIKEFAEPLKPIRGEILELQGPIADASKAVADLVESLLRGEVEVVKKGTTAKVNPLSPVEAANAIFQKAKAEKLRVDRPISIEARFDPDGQSLGFQLSAAISDDSMFDVK